MSGYQVAIFAVVIAAYVAGWISRGPGIRRARPESARLPDEARDALASGMATCRAALDRPGSVTRGELDHALARVASVAVALVGQLGPDDERVHRLERLATVLVMASRVADAPAGPATSSA